MRNDVQKQINVYTSAHHKEKLRRGVILCLALIVALCTAYALILPAITLSSSPEDEATGNTSGISENPIFSISADLKKKEAEETASQQSINRKAVYAEPILAAANQDSQDLKDYVESHSGSMSFTLLDKDNKELPKDSSGNYVADPDTEYNLYMTISLPEGIAPGTYQYSLPAGVLVNGGNGTFTLDNGTAIGTWNVSSSGLFTLVFNENSDNYTNVTITASMGAKFSEGESPIKFDGNITVVVEKSPEDEKTTELSKWGSQGDGSESRPNTSKIYWTIEILGNEKSNIPGNIITDIVTSGNHTYTESDMAGGITFGVSQRDPVTHDEVEWHSWTVYDGDPNLDWTETGWTYRIPETVKCDYCGELKLESENWWYWVKYTSTPGDTAAVGIISYTNHVTVDGQYDDGWAGIKHGQADAGIVKNGYFQGNENGGFFIWTVTATIPGMKEGENAAYFWYLWDTMRIKDSGNTTIGYINNDMNLAAVEVSYGGKSFKVPKLADAGADDIFAWDSTWEDDHDGDGIYYGRQIDFFHRCDCTEGTCQLWNNGCQSHESYKNAEGKWVDTDFCRCWTLPEDAIFTFYYETDNPDVIEEYGGSGNLLQNSVSLNQKQKTGSDSWENVGISDAEALVAIPGLFKKELTHDYDGYVAKYTITVNEAKLKLTSDGSPLKIKDVMTETLAYISGSLVIETEDKDGKTATLSYGEDFTVSYDGSGEIKDEVTGSPVHVMDIEIKNPKDVKYTLYYDAALIIPPGTAEGVKYSNSASIELFGKTITSDSGEKVYADINISAKHYSVTIDKTAADTGQKLAGAEFGLYNENGGLICSGLTDENGSLTFATNVTNGIILYEHTPYYIQEIKAPQGYNRSIEKHWIFFCDSNGTCQKCSVIESNPDYGNAKPVSENEVLNIVNELNEYELPETGGTGTAIFYIAGAALVIVAGVLLAARRRMNKNK